MYRILLDKVYPGYGESAHRVSSIVWSGKSYFVANIILYWTWMFKVRRNSLDAVYLMK